MRFGILKTAVLATLALSVTASHTRAETWIGSVVQAVECYSDGTCGTPDFGGVEPVSFVHIDTDRKLITLLGPESRRGEKTEIQNVKVVEKTWFLSGLEHGRAWTMVISEWGDVTFTITVDGTTRSVFGKVIPAEQVKP